MGSLKLLVHLRTRHFKHNRAIISASLAGTSQTSLACWLAHLRQKKLSLALLPLLTNLTFSCKQVKRIEEAVIAHTYHVNICISQVAYFLFSNDLRLGMLNCRNDKM